MRHKRPILAGVGVALTVLVCAQWASRSPRNPFVSMTASGKAKLEVKPTEPDGKCPALCRLTIDGKLAWEKTLPYSFSETGVSDSGFVAGVGTGQGKGDWGDFVIAILDPKGKTLQEDRIPITMSRYTDAGFDPKCPGIIFDSENDRLVVRISDYDLNRQQETWREYQLSTGNRLDDVQPSLPGSRWMMDARPVKGTNLYATCWYTYGGGSMGLKFALMDHSGHAVWQQDAPEELDNGKSNDEEFDLRSKAEDVGTVFDNPTKERFTVWMPKKRQKVTYQVVKTGSRVTAKEVGRQSFTGEITKVVDPSVARLAKIPVEASFTIPEDAAPPTDIKNIDQFYFWGNDKIVFLRTGETAALCVTDLKSRVLRTIPLPMKAQRDQAEIRLGHFADGRFLVTSSSSQDFGKTRKQDEVHAWTIDVATGQTVEFKPFSSYSVTAVACFPDGRFATLSREDVPYSSADHLVLYSADGKMIWDKREFGYGGKPEEFLTPEDVAVDSEGRIVVLDNIGQSLMLFDSTGKFLKKIEFKKVWGREASYPTNVTCLRSGGYWLNDFSSEKPCMLLDERGTIKRDFSLTFHSGKTFQARDDIRVDSAGNAWVTDGNSFYQVNEKGIPEKTVGNPPRTDGLGEIAEIHVSIDGRIYAEDEKTQAVYAFDHAGKQLFVARPKPSEFDGSRIFQSLNVTRSGDIYLGGSKVEGMIHFSPNGERLADVPYPEDKDPGKDEPFEVKPTWRWWGTRLLDDHSKVMARLRNWPDGSWMLDGPATAAPDNRLMAYSGSGWRSRTAGGEPKLGFFAANGTPETQTRFPLSSISVLGVAYDGTNAYFATEVGLIAVNKKGEVLWCFVPPGWKPNQISNVFPSLGKLAVCDDKRHVVWIDPSKAKVGTATCKLVSLSKN